MQLKQLSIIIAGTLCAGSLLLPGTGARSVAKAENLPEFYDSGSFVGQPTVSAEVTDETSLAALSGEELPASVILTVDETLAVLGGNDGSLGTLSEIYTADAAEKMLLVVRPETSEALTAFAAYEKENSIEEFAVLSDDVLLLNKAMTECPEAYLFLETGKMYTLEEYQAALQRANLVGAQVIVLNGETCEAEYVRYLQARFKSVWVHTDGSETAVADAVGYGAYGIIAPQAAPVYGVYQKIASAAEAYTGTGNLSILARSPFIAAHRGDTAVYSENTVGAVVDAAKTGSTHVEIDIRLTADNQIVLLHDDSIQYALRNPDGSAASGFVSKMTLQQLKSYAMSDGVSTIATLDEIFEAVNTEETKDLILIIEIKGTEPALVSEFAKKVNEYGMADRIAVISFFPAQLTEVQRLLPELSCSYLQYTTDGGTAVSQSHAHHAGIDMQFDGDDTSGIRGFYGDGSSAANSYNAAFRAFADRGYALWLWTYNIDTMNEALRNGVTGITTDDSHYTKDTAKRLIVEKEYEVTERPAELSDFTIQAETYAGTITEIPATVVYLSRGEKDATAVLVGKTNYGVALVSESVTFRLKEEPEPRKGCGSAAASCALAAVAGAVGALTVRSGKRRK